MPQIAPHKIGKIILPYLVWQKLFCRENELYGSQAPAELAGA